MVVYTKLLVALRFTENINAKSLAALRLTDSITRDDHRNSDNCFGSIFLLELILECDSIFIPSHPLLDVIHVLGLPRFPLLSSFLEYII